MESGKAAAVAGGGGALGALPYLLAGGAASPLAGLAALAAAGVSSVLFGVTYRYALRGDLGNTQLKVRRGRASEPRASRDGGSVPLAKGCSAAAGNGIRRAPAGAAALRRRHAQFMWQKGKGASVSQPVALPESPQGGVVAAFGLVRGLAQAGEILGSAGGAEDLAAGFPLAALAMGQAMLTFGFASAALEFGFRQGYVRTFGAAAAEAEAAVAAKGP